MMRMAPVVGMVLCGGRSTRMGQDKNEVMWAGRTLLQHVVSALEPICARLLLIKSTPEQRLPDFEVRIPVEILVDEVPHRGPAASVRVGLEALWRSFESESCASAIQPGTPTEALPLVLLTGNDSPLLQTPLLGYLAQRLHGHAEFDAVVPSPSAGLLDSYPLCAAYRLRCRESLSLYLEQGGCSLKGWLERLRVDWVSTTELRAHDPDLRSLLNFNSPADLQFDPSE